MREEIKSGLVEHYGLKRRVVDFSCESTRELEFDLSDTKQRFIVPFRQGGVSFVRETPTVAQVLNYEAFINSFGGTAFERGRKRCDFVAFDEQPEPETMLLIELTSSKDDTANLGKPIDGYPGGKFEKAEAQLSGSLETLLNVDEIRAEANRYKRRVCLMAYKIITKPTLPISAEKAFSSYLAAEAKATGSEGALLSSPEINRLGFEFRRISHDYVFNL